MKTVEIVEGVIANFINVADKTLFLANNKQDVIEKIVAEEIDKLSNLYSKLYEKAPQVKVTTRRILALKNAKFNKMRQIVAFNEKEIGGMSDKQIILILRKNERCREYIKRINSIIERYDDNNDGAYKSAMRLYSKRMKQVRNDITRILNKYSTLSIGSSFDEVIAVVKTSYSSYLATVIKELV